MDQIFCYHTIANFPLRLSDLLFTTAAKSIAGVLGKMLVDLYF